MMANKKMVGVKPDGTLYIEGMNEGNEEQMINVAVLKLHRYEECGLSPDELEALIGVEGIIPTNGQKVRRMTDDEMASFFLNPDEVAAIGCSDKHCEFYGKNGVCEHPGNSERECKKAILRWLADREE